MPSEENSGFLELDILRRRVSEAEKRHLPSGGGGGIYDGMEARVASLEANVGHLKEDVSEIRKDIRELRTDLKADFRWLFTLGIGAFGALVALMAHGFHWY